jgi:three-Cys-motif partner protein
MPSQRLDTLWDARPHTIAKIEILEGYLLAWFQILGRTKQSKDLLYVDGFAGPGKYRNHSKGSPIAALVAAKSAISLLGNNWKAGNIHCVFIEPDKKRFLHLSETIQPFEGSERLRIHKYKASFVEGLSQFESESPSLLAGGSPRFIFIDPFGATGVPFSTVKSLLTNQGAEVLINLDADGIVRIFQAQGAANHEQLLNEIFGDDSWKEFLSSNMPFDKLCYEALKVYKNKLRNLPNVNYVFPFEMRAYRNTLNYFLVFASQHYLGLEKMKEVMKKIDQSGSFCFSDANVQQDHLFRFNEPAEYSGQLYGHFKGAAVTYKELRDYALNETPFLNPKGMLKDLEDKKLIKVQSDDLGRRQGTFNEEKIRLIEFI